MTQAIKLIALDLDGTLALENHQVSPATRASLQQLHHSGVEVVIATGRRYRTTQYVVENLGLSVFCVCNGGALVKDKQRQTLANTPFSITEAGQVVTLARQLDLTVTAQRDSHEFGGADFVIDSANVWNHRLQQYYEQNAEFSSKADLLASDDRFLVLGVFDRIEKLKLLTEQLSQDHQQRFNTIIVPHLTSDFYYCEITLNKVDKWHGLNPLLGHFNITEKNVCAVGDQVNDLAMIQAAAHGVAMGNASDALKSEANFICGNHDEDGLLDVVAYIQKFNAQHVP